MGFHQPRAHDHERVGAAAAPALPLVERQLADVRDEVGFPHPAAVQLGLGVEVVGLTLVAVVEVVVVVEDEVLGVPLPKKLGQVGDREPARRLRQAGVEELVPGVGGGYEVAARTPLEGLLLAALAPHRAGAVAGHHVDGFGVHVPQRRSVASGRQLDDVLVAAVVAVEVAQGTSDAVALARPRAHLHRLHVLDVDPAHERHALAVAPVGVGVHARERGLFLRVQGGGGYGHGGTSFFDFAEG